MLIALLEILRRDPGPHLVADLAERTGLDPESVSGMVAALRDIGLVASGRPESPCAGCPAALSGGELAARSACSACATAHNLLR